MIDYCPLARRPRVGASKCAFTDYYEYSEPVSIDDRVEKSHGGCLVWELLYRLNSFFAGLEEEEGEKNDNLL